MHGPFINTSLPSAKRVYTNEICTGLLKTCLIWQVGIILKWNSWKRVGTSLGYTLLQLVKMQGCEWRLPQTKIIYNKSIFGNTKLRKLQK